MTTRAASAFLESKMGQQRVAVFTASGTFRGSEGRIVERTRDGAYVQLENEKSPLHFTRSELVQLDEQHHAGAE